MMGVWGSQSSVSGDALPAVPAAITGIGAARVVFLGASITNGSSSSNAGSTSFAPRVKSASDHMQVSECIRAGYPGQPASYIAAQVQAAIDLAPQYVVIGPDFGTNSATLSTTNGVYEEYGRHVIDVVRACRSVGIEVFACRTMPRGIEQNQYSGTAAAAGTTTTIVLPESAVAVEYLVGAQIEINGDGVIRAIRSYNSGTRTAGFTPAAGSETSSSTTFVISGAGAVHRGCGLQNLWLSQNAGKIGIRVIDAHTPMCNSRGFLNTAFYASGADPVHPNDAGHQQLATTIAASLALWLPRMQHPATVASGAVFNPLMQGPASGSLPSGMSTISPTTMGGTKTYSILETSLGDAPGRTANWIFDTSASGHGNFRVGFVPNVACAPGDKLFVVGTVEAAGDGTVSLVAWNGNTNANISNISGGAQTAPFAARTFAAVTTVPSGCTSFSVAVYVTTTAGQVLTVRAAGLQAWNLTQLGISA